MATYSYPLTMPTNVGFTQSSWKLMRQVAVTESPFTGEQDTFEYSKALWQGTFTLPPMLRSDVVQWQSFFMKLHGRKGTFLIGDPDAKVIQGAATGSVTTATALSVGDDTVDISITASDGTIAFKAGDYIQLGTGADAKLHMVVNDATVTGNGATLDIEPYIKADLSSGSNIDYTSAQGVFRMDDNNLTWDADHVSKYGLTFSCTEVM